MPAVEILVQIGEGELGFVPWKVDYPPTMWEEVRTPLEPDWFISRETEGRFSQLYGAIIDRWYDTGTYRLRLAGARLDVDALVAREVGEGREKAALRGLAFYDTVIGRLSFNGSYGLAAEMKYGYFRWLGRHADDTRTRSKYRTAAGKQKGLGWGATLTS